MSLERRGSPAARLTRPLHARTRLISQAQPTLSRPRHAARYRSINLILWGPQSTPVAPLLGDLRLQGCSKGRCAAGSRALEMQIQWL